MKEPPDVSHFHHASPDAVLTDDAWLTMPPLPHAYQGHSAVGAFLRGAEERRGAPMRLVATRANTQPAFGCYVTGPDLPPVLGP